MNNAFATTDDIHARRRTEALQYAIDQLRRGSVGHHGRVVWRDKHSTSRQVLNAVT